VFGRYANRRRIRALDPHRDHLEIFQLMLREEFPWDLRMALNLAFNRSFSLPPIARVLTGSGELLERTRKRIDDTGLLMYEIIINGFDHPRSRAAVARMNAMHRRRRDDNDLFLYVLGALVVTPVRWLDRYGWRRPDAGERVAVHETFKQLGVLMGIADIPESYEDFARWFAAYDEENLTPSEEAAAIERATRSLLIGRLPGPLHRLGDALVSSLYDERLRAAVGAPKAPWAVKVALHLALRVRARLLRWFARPRRVPLFADGIHTRTYPDGYEISRLGP
jgi:hypothetical protein